MSDEINQISNPDLRTKTLNAFRRIQDKIQKLRDLRIAVVVSAGNEYGGRQGMGYPAILPGCISVGSVFDSDMPQWSFNGSTLFDLKADQITPYSQRLHETINPSEFTTVFAPGSVATSVGINGDNSSLDENGTSQAAPVVTGVILLMQELYRKEKNELPPVDQLVRWLRMGSVPILDSDSIVDDSAPTGLEFIRVDALQALQAVHRDLHSE